MKTILSIFIGLALAASTFASSATATVGQKVTISVTASGTTPFSYQWSKDGAAISGATSASYALASVATTDAGSYTCVVSNSAGSAASDAATLAVVVPVVAPTNATTTISIGG